MADAEEAHRNRQLPNLDIHSVTLPEGKTLCTCENQFPSSTKVRKPVHKEGTFQYLVLLGVYTSTLCFWILLKDSCTSEENFTVNSPTNF